MVYKERLDARDRQLLALRDAFESRGLLDMDPETFGDVEELLHQGDYSDAWEGLTACIRLGDQVTPDERSELVSLLLDGESDEAYRQQYGISATDWLDQILGRGPEEPFPYLT